MFLVFFGDIDGVEIPDADRKWFLTAYASILAFYFGSRYFPERGSSRGLVIFSVSPPISNPPTGDGTADETIEIEGNGFESPKSVAFVQGGVNLPTSNFTPESNRRISVDVTLAKGSNLGPYDVILELANGSRIVKTYGYSLEKAGSTENDED